jgi:2-desacetyl-2-hydroxyethyl bacteriochlorophyllide A dehydrogenase
VLQAEDRPEPVRGEADVLVRVRRVGVCGTDLHIFTGDQPYLEYPRVMGHELSGVVAEAPAGSRLRTGDPVFVMPYLSCGTCVACRVGKTNCCVNIQVLGVHRDGAFTELLAVPQAFVHQAEGVSLDQAAMVEFLAIGAHAVRRGEVAAGQRVLVVGTGPIGMAALIFSRLRGATVTALDTRAERIDFCVQSLGAEAGVQVDDEDEARLAELSGGEFFDVVFDATGNRQAMERGFRFVAHGGKYVLVSIVRDSISFADPEFHKRETTLLSSRNATLADFATVVAAMRAGQVPTRAIRTHSAPLWEAAERMPDWIRPEAGTVKAVLEL